MAAAAKSNPIDSDVAVQLAKMIRLVCQMSESMTQVFARLNHLSAEVRRCQLSLKKSKMSLTAGHNHNVRIKWRHMPNAEFAKTVREMPLSDFWRLLRREKVRTSTGSEVTELRQFELLKSERRVMAGGQGIVFFVRHTSNSITYAMKVCNHRQDTEKVTRHVHRAAIQVRSQKLTAFVSQLVCSFVTENFFITVSPKAKFCSLLELLSRVRCFPPHYVVYYFACVASAITQMHELSICHRDIKCDNVLIAANGLPQLTDFGLATVSMAGKTKYFPNQHVTGMRYYPPEARILGAQVNDFKIDMWLLGFALSEMIVMDRRHLCHKYRGSEKPGWEFKLCLKCHPPSEDWLQPTLDQLLTTSSLRRPLMQEFMERQTVSSDLAEICQRQPPSIQDILKQ